jgi:hypothetical protein
MEFSVSSTDEWDVRSGFLSEGESVVYESASSVQHHVIHDHSYLDDYDDSDDDDLFGSKNINGSGGAGSAQTGNARKLKAKRTTKLLNLAFLFISFGYMLPWTSLGSLISYYKYTYSAGFYVKLYCAYYLPGLPVALLQHRFDSYFDHKFGSRATYLCRGTFCFLSMSTILLLMLWIDDAHAIFFLFMLLGICGWLCHGTASMLASMFPSSAIAYLQTGFRCPEIYTISAVALLQIGKNPTTLHLHLFFGISAAVVGVGLVAWILVVTSDTARNFFEAKDHSLVSDISERLPLFGSDQQQQQSQLQSSKMAGTREALYDPNLRSVSADDEDGGAGRDGEAIGLLSNGSNKGLTDEQRAIESIYARPLARAKKLLQEVENATMKSGVFHNVWPLCAALFITIWCSIFQAAFFAYVDSPQGRDIEQILYFIRLFSDLFGRPLTRVPRPWFVQVSREVGLSTFHVREPWCHMEPI